MEVLLLDPLWNKSLLGAFFPQEAIEKEKEKKTEKTTKLRYATKPVRFPPTMATTLGVRVNRITDHLTGWQLGKT